ncbi:MAG TPA: FtsX-like permease family protein, partial [bacterium]|nr:FtsX-like permease family protein [bacterium]
DRPSLYKNFADTPELYAAITGDPQVRAATPRIHSSALAFVETKTTGVKLIGIDPDREKRTTRLAAKVSEGAFLPATAAKQALIGRNVADVLKAKVGSELVLISQGADGSVANDLFTVGGILGDAKDTSEQNNVYLHITDAQDYLMLGGKIHEIAVLFADHKKAEKMTERLGATLATAGFRDLSAESWMEVEPEFYRTMQADRKGDNISQFIIMLIVAVGVLNTVLMTVLERTREYGVMAAIGTSPRRIFSLIVIETAMLALASCLIGAFLASFALWYFVAVGISYPEPVTIAGLTLTTLRSEFSAIAYYKPLLIVVLTAVLVSVLPAIRAARIRPIDALRSL